MQDLQDQVLTRLDFHVGLLKVVRNIFNGTLDFDDTAEITPDFLPGPLPCSSSVFLTSWQWVGVRKKLLLQDYLRDCRAPKLLAPLQISLGRMPRNSEQSISAHKLQGCQLSVSSPGRKKSTKSLEALEICNSLAPQAAGGSRQNSSSRRPQSLMSLVLDIITFSLDDCHTSLPTENTVFYSLRTEKKILIFISNQNTIKWNKSIKIFCKLAWTSFMLYLLNNRLLWLCTTSCGPFPQRYRL